MDAVNGGESVVGTPSVGRVVERPEVVGYPGESDKQQVTEPA